MLKLLESLTHTSKLSVTLLLFAGMLSSCGKSSEADFQKFVQQQNCITTSEVVRNFETIKDRVQTLFSQSNRVCGIVKQIASLSDSPHPMIALEAPGWKGLINVGDVDKATVAGMSEGDFAVFECREISNAYWYPFLHSCRVANRQTTGAVANEVGTREIPATAQNSAYNPASTLGQGAIALNWLGSVPEREPSNALGKKGAKAVPHGYKPIPKEGWYAGMGLKPPKFRAQEK